MNPSHTIVLHGSRRSQSRIARNAQRRRIDRAGSSSWKRVLFTTLPRLTGTEIAFLDDSDETRPSSDVVTFQSTLIGTVTVVRYVRPPLVIRRLISDVSPTARVRKTPRRSISAS